uniref:SFRICE_031444 n=1 Tax=Spodoptera frugiperda TaxID=7108 RepID=A0A2H1WV71_SPOFR
MEAQADPEHEHAMLGVDNSAAEGDGDRGRYSDLCVIHEKVHPVVVFLPDCQGRSSLHYPE